MERNLVAVRNLIAQIIFERNGTVVDISLKVQCMHYLEHQDALKFQKLVEKQKTRSNFRETLPMREWQSADSYLLTSSKY